LPSRRGAPPSRGGNFTVFDSGETPTHRAFALTLGGALCDTADHAGHPKLTPKPSTASNRLTPQEIDELRESARRMGEKMRSWLAARKKQTEAKQASLNAVAFRPLLGFIS
jgi:hypothetical protein